MGHERLPRKLFSAFGLILIISVWQASEQHWMHESYLITPAALTLLTIQTEGIQISRDLKILPSLVEDHVSLSMAFFDASQPTLKEEFDQT